MYIINGAYSVFHLMHHKILMNIIKCGGRICEGSDLKGFGLVRVDKCGMLDMSLSWYKPMVVSGW